jgi:hypothetical protein
MAKVKLDPTKLMGYRIEALAEGAVKTGLKLGDKAGAKTGSKGGDPV